MLLPLAFAYNATTSTYIIEASSTGIVTSNATTSTYHIEESGSKPTVANNGSTASYAFSVGGSQVFYCGDGHCNNEETLASCEKDCTIEVAGRQTQGASASSGSSSSTTDSTSTRKTKTFNIEITDEPTQSTFIDGDKLILKLEDREIELEVLEVNSKKVTLYVTEEERAIAIYEGHKKKADLNWDGVYDVFITIDSLEDGTATITIELYSEAEDVGIEEAEEVEPEVVEQLLAEQETKKIFWGVWILISLGIALIVVVTAIILKKKK